MSTAAAETSSDSAARAGLLRRALSTFGSVLGLAVVCALFAALRFETFVTWDNFAIVLQQTAVIGIAALGMTLVIISGGIDLSVGSIIALVTVVIALLLQHNWPPLLAVLGGVGAAAVCGGFSGLLITRLRLLPQLRILFRRQERGATRVRRAAPQS